MKKLNLEDEIKKINVSSRDYGVIDRFFFIHREFDILIESFPEALQIKYEALSKIVSSIKYCYGIHDFDSYLQTERTVFYSNPLLLSVSPFIMSLEEWKSMALHEIKNEKLSSSSFYNINKVFKNCLEDGLFRARIEQFIDYSNTYIINSKLHCLGSCHHHLEDYMQVMKDENVFEYVSKIKTVDDLKELVKKINLTTKNISKLKLRGKSEEVIPVGQKEIKEYLLKYYNNEFKDEIIAFVYKYFEVEKKSLELRPKGVLTDKKFPINNKESFIEFFWVLKKEGVVLNTFSQISELLSDVFPSLGDKTTIEKIPSEKKFLDNYKKGKPSIRKFLLTRMSKK